MTHDDAMDKLAHAAQLVEEVRAVARQVTDPNDLRGRFALRDAVSEIGRAQDAIARDMRRTVRST